MSEGVQPVGAGHFFVVGERFFESTLRGKVGGFVTYRTRTDDQGRVWASLDGRYWWRVREWEDVKPQDMKPKEPMLWID